MKPDMGIELVKTVAARHGSLSGNAYKLLVYMASVALDRPNDKGQPPNLYYAGWEPLALALGYELAAAGVSADGDRRRRQAEEAVRRGVQVLVERGLIEREVEHARTRQRQRLRLTLSPCETQGLSPCETQGQEPLQIAGESPCETQGPRRTKDVGEDLLPQDSTAAACDLLTDRARKADEIEIHPVEPETGHPFRPARRGSTECRICHEDELSARHAGHVRRSA